MSTIRTIILKAGFCFLTICFAIEGFAQEDAMRELFHKHRKLGIILSHTQVSQGVQSNGDEKWLALPSIGPNYNYKFHPKWALGLHSDIVIEDYEVEEHLKSGGGDRVL